jgi:hypothetical protein
MKKFYLHRDIFSLFFKSGSSFMAFYFCVSATRQDHAAGSLISDRLTDKIPPA